MITTDGQPVEFFLLPGAASDTGALPWYQFDLPAGATILGDKAFNVYGIEDELAQSGIPCVRSAKRTRSERSRSGKRICGN
jgi:hypothetical protein